MSSIQRSEELGAGQCGKEQGPACELLGKENLSWVAIETFIKHVWNYSLYQLRIFFKEIRSQMAKCLQISFLLSLARSVKCLLLDDLHLLSSPFFCFQQATLGKGQACRWACPTLRFPQDPFQGPCHSLQPVSLLIFQFLIFLLRTTHIRTERLWQLALDSALNSSSLSSQQVFCQRQVGREPSPLVLEHCPAAKEPCSKPSPPAGSWPSPGMVYVPFMLLAVSSCHTSSHLHSDRYIILRKPWVEENRRPRKWVICSECLSQAHSCRAA